jgi:hypothetical protein
METITYRQRGDYLLPEISIKEDQPSYGKYGMLRKTYLKNHKSEMYSSLLFSGQLNAHLAEIDGLSRTILDGLINDYLKTHPAPDRATQQMEWVGHINNIRSNPNILNSIENRRCAWT